MVLARGIKARPGQAFLSLAVVLPELFGPTNPTGLPSSISASSKRLKMRMVILVSIRIGPLRGFVSVRRLREAARNA